MVDFYHQWCTNDNYSVDHDVDLPDTDVNFFNVERTFFFY